jgi:hypothetical protein
MTESGKPLAGPSPERTQSDDPQQENQIGQLGPEQMKELFRKQRDELRLNRERIKKVRDGSHETDLMPTEDLPKRSSKPAAPTPAIPPPEEPKLDLSQALNRQSAGKFMKSRSLVLEQLETEVCIEPETSEQQVAQDSESLSSIPETGKALNDEREEHPEIRMPMGQPVVSEDDSPAYRAEAICMVLEREIGIEKLLRLKQLANGEGERTQIDEILHECHPAMVLLAQQFLVLESELSSK